MTKLKIRTADGTSHRIKKVARILVNFAGKCKEVDFHLLPSISKTLILGTNFWNTFNIRPKIFEIDHEIIEPENSPIRNKLFKIIKEDLDIPKDINEMFTTTKRDKRPYASISIFETKTKGLLDSGRTLAS